MKGIDKVREHFAGAESHYALIGGAACDLIFSEAGLSFRQRRMSTWSSALKSST